MNSDNYRILFHDIVLADHMSLGIALLFLETLFQKFCNEPSVQYIIEKIPEEGET